MNRKDNPLLHLTKVVRKDNREQGYYKKNSEYDSLFSHFTQENTKNTSLDGHIDSKGKLTKERKQLHINIIADMFKKARPTNNKTYIVMSGGSGSGKGHILNNYVMDSEKENFVKIDVDDIRMMLPEYSKFRMEKQADGSNLAAAKTHQEASAISKLANSYAISNGYSVIFDCTFSSDSHVKAVKTVKIKGYRTELYGSLVSENVAKINALKRGISSGRYVPDYKISESNFMNKQKVVEHIVKDNTLFDNVELYDNDGSVDHIEPKKIFSNGNILDQQSFIKHFKEHF